MKLLIPFATALCLAEASIVSQFSSPGRLTGSSFGIPSQNATYDYIIVGGGLAGSVVASRLTEKSNATVAIVEAGNFYELNNGNWSQIPYYSEEFAGAEPDDYNPLVDFGLVTEPQVNGEMIHYAQGRNLGGSSGRNQMLYHRPTVGYYQAWAEQVNDSSWLWENMLPFYERSMNFSTPAVTGAQKNNITYDPAVFLPSANMSNPLHVSYLSWTYPLSAYAPYVYEAIGLSEQAGFSSGVLDGYGFWTYTIDPSTGLRSSAESSFLEEAFNRDSLTVYLQSLVQNVIFDSNKTAVGVNVTSSPAGTRTRYYTLNARKEVILSAGAWHSPQILMLSGIGPQATLEQYGIPVISNREGVGQNMWDTTNIGGVVHEINDTFVTFSEISANTSLYNSATSQILTSATGPLTDEGTDTVGWLKIPVNVTSTLSNATRQHLASLPADWPELEVAFSTTSRSLEFGTDTRKLGSINPLMIGTAGRGNMTISSNSILDPPIINPNWLRDPRDQEVAVAAFKLARQAWQGLPEGIRVGEETFPGANVTSDADLLQAIMGNIAPIHHASASCAPGTLDDPMAVIDSRGSVIGVTGLRVVDSSSLRFTPPGHTQGVTYGHAERMAQIILDANSY